MDYLLLSRRRNSAGGVILSGVADVENQFVDGPDLDLKGRSGSHALSIAVPDFSRQQKYYRVLTVQSRPELRVVGTRLQFISEAVFGMAWKVLLQRFENTITHHNFPGPRNPDEKGLLLCDHTEDEKLRAVMRQMRRFNPIPNRQGMYVGGHRDIPVLTILEDPNFRQSEHSYFIQAVDLASFLLYQRHAPNKYMRKNSGQNYFMRLRPVLCLHASPRDPDGIVRL